MSGSMPHPVDVAAAILRRDHAFLAVQKPGGLWEFPGGKREAGESLEDCLRRELGEELQLQVDALHFAASVEHPPYRLHFFYGELPGLPVLTEHRRLGLFPGRMLLRLPMSPPDRVMAQRLALQDPPIRHVVWDLDGTLMDTYPRSAQALARVLRSHGLDAEEGEVLSRMKERLGDCLRHYAPLVSLPEEELRTAYRREVAQTEPQMTPIPGIPEALEALSRMGCAHYLWTHRDDGAWTMLENCGLRHYFRDGVTAAAGCPAKPNPTGLLTLMRRNGIPPAETLMIGDRLIDLQGGQLAGVLTVLLADGYVDVTHPSVELAVATPGTLEDIMTPLWDEVS